MKPQAYSSLTTKINFRTTGGTLRHFIRPVIFRIIGICTCAYLATSTLCAQPSITRTETLHNSNPWLAGTNPAGLIFNPKIRISTARAAYQLTKGDYRKATAAPTSHRYTLSSESFLQLKNVQLYGNIGYTDDIKQNHRWSAMQQPEGRLLSLGDSVSGRQNAEEYHISSSLALPLSKHWSIGSALDYRAHAIAKNTDPRYKNIQTDILFSPGVIFSSGPLHIGANFIFRQTTENIAYSSLEPGISEMQTFFPLWFYQKEEFEKGLNTTRTYQNRNYAGALQFATGSRHWKWFNEFRYNRSKELAQVNANNRAGQTERKEFNYTGSLTLRGTLLHRLRPEYRRSYAIGSDNLQSDPEEASANQMENHGLIRRSSIITDEAALRYTLARPCDSLVNRWAVHSRLGYYREKTLFFIYPACLTQSVTRLSFSGGYEQRIPVRKNLIEIAANIQYTTGHGHLPEISSTTDTPLPEIKMAQQKDLLQRDFQIQTAETISVSIRLQYTYTLNSRYALFSSATAGYTRALTPDISNLFRTNGGISAGILF